MQAAAHFYLKQHDELPAEERFEAIVWVSAKEEVLALAVATAVYAQTGGDFDLSWNTMDNGGAVNATAGDFEISGSIGQAEAGTLSGGDFELSGGFWYYEATAGYRILLPLVMKN